MEESKKASFYSKLSIIISLIAIIISLSVTINDVINYKKKNSPIREFQRSIDCLACGDNILLNYDLFGKVIKPLEDNKKKIKIGASTFLVDKAKNSSSYLLKKDGFMLEVGIKVFETSDKKVIKMISIMKICIN